MALLDARDDFADAQAGLLDAERCERDQRLPLLEIHARAIARRRRRPPGAPPALATFHSAIFTTFQPAAVARLQNSTPSGVSPA